MMLRRAGLSTHNMHADKSWSMVNGHPLPRPHIHYDRHCMLTFDYVSQYSKINNTIDKRTTMNFNSKHNNTFGKKFTLRGAFRQASMYCSSISGPPHPSSRLFISAASTDIGGGCRGVNGQSVLKAGTISEPPPTTPTTVALHTSLLMYCLHFNHATLGVRSKLK